MVITSALHAEGREFEPRQNLREPFPGTKDLVLILHTSFITFVGKTMLVLTDE